VDGCAVEVRKLRARRSRIFETTSPLRHSGEGESDGLPPELRNAIAVADGLLEPRSAIPEKATIDKTEEKEEGTATGDGDGKEESSSKARTN
jgi:hypothetical protein